MYQVSYVPVTDSVVKELCENIRDCDREELGNTIDRPVEDAVSMSVASSSSCGAAYINGEIISIFGVCGDGAANVPWAVGSKAMNNKKYKRTIIHNAKIIIDDMRAFGELHNYVQSDNYPAIRLLKALGFTLGEPEPMYHKGVLFTYFHMEA